MEFAPKLDAGISYERPQQVTAPVDYGRALTSGVSDVFEVLKDSEKDKPTWSQVKDEAEAAGNREFSLKLGVIDQLRAQGKPREAANAGRALVQYAADNGINMNDPEIKGQLEARDIALAEIGETPEDTRNRKQRETPEYKQAEVIVYTSKDFEKMSDQQKENEVNRMTSQSMLDKATIAYANQNDVTSWHAVGKQAVERSINTHIQSQVAEAQAAARLGIQIDPTQMEAKATEIAGMLAGMASIFPVDLPVADREKAMAPLKAAQKVVEALQSRGTDVSAGSVANLVGALSSNTDAPSAAVVAILAGGLRSLTPDTIDVILPQGAGSVAAALKAMSSPDAKTFYFGAGKNQWGYGKRVRKSSDPLSKTLEGPDGKPATPDPAVEFTKLVSPDILQRNKNTDARALLRDFNTNAKAFDLMNDPGESTDEAAFNFGLISNAAAAVYNSKDTFSAADVDAGYGPGFFNKLALHAKLYPGLTAGVTRATQLAVQAMAAKAVARVEDATQGWLQYNGSTLLLDYSKFTSQEYSVGGNPETQTRMQTEVKAAVESAGGFSEFLKMYDSYDQPQGRSPYSAFVRNFMSSNEVRDIRKQLPAIREQTKAIVALSQTSVRLQAMLGKIANDTRDEIYNAGGESAGANDVWGGENVPLVSSPVPIPRPRPDLPVEPEVVQEPERRGGILGLGGFPQTDGVPLGERAVAKANIDIEDVAKLLISPAAAGSLDIENKATSTLMDALVQIESNGNPNAVSSAGARGLYQLMPATAAQPGFGVKPLSTGKDIAASSPAEQKRFATDYLNAMLNRYNGNLGLALAAYNGGAGTVDKYLKDGKALPKETVEYVQKFKDAGAFDTDPVQSNSPIQPANAAGTDEDRETALRQSALFANLPSTLPSKEVPIPRARPTIPQTRLGSPVPVPRKRPSESPTPGRNLPALDEGQSWLSRNVGQPLATVAVSLASQTAGAVGGPAFAFLVGDLLDAQLGGNWRSFDQTDMSPEYSTATHNAVKLAYANGKSKTTYGVWASMAVAYENQALVEQYYGGDLVAAAKDKLAKAPKADRPSFPTVQESLSWSPGGKGKVEATMTNPYINLMYTFGEAGFKKEGEGFRITDQYDNNWYRDYTRPSGGKAYTQVSTEEFEKFKGKRTLVQLFEESRKAYKDGKLSLFGLVHNSQYLFGSRDWTDDTKDESKKINMFFEGRG